MLAAHEDMATAGAEVFSEDLLKKYVERFSAVEATRDRILKSLLGFDGLLILVLLGKDLTVPVIGLKLSEFPAAREVMSVAASFSFLVLVMSIVSWHGYSTLIDQFAIIQSRRWGIDPDYLIAAHKNLDFFVKIFRPKLNIWDEDYHEPTGRFSLWVRCVLLASMLAFLILVAMHLAVVGWAGYAIVREDQWLLSGLIVAFLLLSNLTAVGMYAITFLPFHFRATDHLFQRWAARERARQT